MVRSVVGPYFFKNDYETTISVNSLRYGHMITNFFSPAIEEYNLENIWFQQDGATRHTTLANVALLQEIFPGLVIFCHGDINWSPRLCDFTPLDVFLWLKNQHSPSCGWDTAQYVSKSGRK